MNANRQPLCSLSLLLTAVVSAGTAHAQRQLAQTLGNQAGARHGAAVAAIGDVDGDGIRDLLIGEPDRDYTSGITDSGAAALVLSRTGAVRSRIVGGVANGHFGSAVAALGDVDGDGTPDWAAGGYAMGVNRAGYIRVMSGADGHMLWQWHGHPSSELGTSIAGLGDVDGDGRPDLAVAAPHDSVVETYGHVLIRNGSDGRLLGDFTGPSQARTGHSIAVIGDISGDGRPDLIIGEPESSLRSPGSGRVFAVNPRPDASPRLLWESYLPYAFGYHAGTAVASCGDLTGDNLPDVLVGMATGAVTVLSGATGSFVRQQFEQNSGYRASYGRSLAGIGDFDGDGSTDFAVGIPDMNNGEGRVMVYRGNGALLAEIVGSGGNFGAALAAIGDFDGDGRDDIAVGAPGFTAANQAVGRVSIHGFTITSIMDTFGTGCAGSAGVPFVYMGGNARVGASFDTRCGNLPRNGAGFWLTGWSRTSANGTPLPFDLGVYGFTGCRLLVSPDETLLFLTGTSNYVSRTWNVPSLPSLAGATIYTQAAMLDGTRPGGMSFSDGGRIRIGNN